MNEVDCPEWVGWRVNAKGNRIGVVWGYRITIFSGRYGKYGYAVVRIAGGESLFSTEWYPLEWMARDAAIEALEELRTGGE